jgi:hypothetical protein
VTIRFRSIMVILMHVLIFIVLILAFIIVLSFGLLSVLQDLLIRSIYQPPSRLDPAARTLGSPDDLSSISAVLVARLWRRSEHHMSKSR